MPRPAVLRLALPMMLVRIAIGMFYFNPRYLL